MEEQNRQTINLREVFRSLKKRWWLHVPIVLIVIGLSCWVILQVPRTYSSQVVLAPEENNTVTGGSLGSLASSFGFDLGNLQSNDAIYPTLYPDLFESTDFVCSLFDIQIETIDGKVRTEYYDYLRNHQQHAPWDSTLNVWREKLKEKPKVSRVNSTVTNGKIDPFMLSERDFNIVEGVKSNIKCDVDKKTDVITITVTDQDPLVCATLADSIKNRLKKFITDYRTSKSRVDYEYYAQLVMQAREEYDRAVERYSEYCDTHKDVILQAYISERDDLENDMQAKYNTYNAYNTQMQSAKAKIQECTPVFTVLQNASVPVKPTGPKRMIFVAAMTCLICSLIFGIEVIKQLFREDLSDARDEE